MNMISQLRQRIRAHGAATITPEDYDQLQREWITRCGADEMVATLRHHLTELAKFADSAALVLATIETESTDEESRIQKIIDGLSTWAPPAMLGTVVTEDQPCP